MTERDPEFERKLGADMLAAIAADLRRSNELQTDMGARLAEGARLKAEDEEKS